jgi:hypothetical protein
MWRLFHWRGIGALPSSQRAASKEESIFHIQQTTKNTVPEVPSSPYHYQLPSKYRHLTSHPLAYEREKNALPAFLLVSLSLRK